MTDDDIMEMLRWTARTLRLDDMHTAADICVAAADRIADLRAAERERDVLAEAVSKLARAGAYGWGFESVRNAITLARGIVDRQNVS